LQVPPEHTVAGAVQALPAQHCWLAPPQATHMLLLVWHNDVLLHLVVPAQQGCPAAPHATQLFDAHTAFELHMLPEQHASPVAPQWVHLLAPHR
jgi:hypothetical protein